MINIYKGFYVLYPQFHFTNDRAFNTRVFEGEWSFARHLVLVDKATQWNLDGTNSPLFVVINNLIRKHFGMLRYMVIKSIELLPFLKFPFRF